MIVPEYSITPEILHNIGNIEYSRGIIENTTILSNWEKQLKKDALIRSTETAVSLNGFNFSKETIKETVDRLSDTPPSEITNYIKAYMHVIKVNNSRIFSEKDIKSIHILLTAGNLDKNSKTSYRSISTPEGTDPQEILAKMVELMDWYQSFESEDTHTILVAGIFKAYMELIVPFERYNETVSNLCCRYILNINGYSLKHLYSLEDHYGQSYRKYRAAFVSIKRNDEDLTRWLEYFTEGLAREFSSVAEKLLLLERDSKIAKASGRVKLTDRQERIVEYLQDYGVLRNKDYGRIFPDLSEDTILRDLKVLIRKNIVVKRGKTKSSVYELK